MKDPAYACLESLVYQFHIADSSAATAENPNLASQSSPRRLQLCAEFIRNTTEDLAKMQNLDPSATILLFTPAVLPSGMRTTKASQTDPFEPLGRSISRYHARVRHVPYVPAVGFTETHAALIQLASAAVVVTCQPTKQPIDASLSKQADFAESVLDAVEDVQYEDIRSRRTLPLFLAQFGPEERRIDLGGYENVLQSDNYGLDSVRQMVQLLFTPSG